VTVGLALALSSIQSPDGSQIHPVDQCFVIERNGKPVGVTHQTIRSTALNGVRVWEVIVHQQIPSRKFDLRDHFVLARRDLLPIAFDSRKDAIEDVKLHYSRVRVTGYRTSDKGHVPIDTALPGPTWEGNLWGVTFGALPLSLGASFTLPFFQYDLGLGQFTLRVIGTEAVHSPEGPIEAWLVDAGINGAQRVTYLIGKQNHEELGYRAMGFASHLGGDCSGVD
jgi:hypothetical protein